MATFNQLKTAWAANGEELRAEINNLYSAIPSSVEAHADLAEDQRTVAFKLAEQLNILKDFLDKAQKIGI